MQRILLVFFVVSVWLSDVVYAQLRAFPVRYISSDVVYLEGGTAAGLQEGMHLQIRRPGPGEAALQSPPLAELLVISVASASAACEIVKSDVMIQVGDQAFIAREDLASQTAASTETETFAQIVEFEEGNPLEQELREQVPKPPLREENHFGGRIGFEQDSILDRSGAGQNSHQQGVTFRFDFTRIGSSYWSLGGYWRARISARKRPVDQESVTDVLQRVYHFGLRYDNPQSRMVLGFGRLLVPWASSLNTLDGGYVGVRVNRDITVGGFAGTTPDPTAWNYDPDRQMGGAFVSSNLGSFERARYTITGGVALTHLDWKPERQFLFVENGILVGQKVSFHHNVEVDYRSLDRFASDKTVSLTRSFATLRIQPVSRLSLDLSHNYFRVLPTPDPRLIITQQLDNLLFQGLNGGARVDILRNLGVYASAGKSSRSGDQNASWNGAGGVYGNIPGLGRAEARYSKFSGTIGTGNYRSVSLRRDVSNRWRLELEGGDQNFSSAFSPGSHTWYGMGSVDVFVGRFVLGFRGLHYQGSAQNYEQVRASLDYRF